jgi:hypothetical protein
MPLTKEIKNVVLHANLVDGEVTRCVAEYCVCVAEDASFMRFANVTVSGLNNVDTLGDSLALIMSQINTKEGL